jgi:hypothetical protein
VRPLLFPESFNRVGLTNQKEGNLKRVRESDHLIVLCDGRADHKPAYSFHCTGMGKGVTGLCSLQRKDVPEEKVVS